MKTPALYSYVRKTVGFQAFSPTVLAYLFNLELGQKYRVNKYSTNAVPFAMWYWAPLSSRNAGNSGFREGDRTGGQRTINTALLQIPPGGDSKLCPVEEGPGSHEETQLIRRPPARRKSAGAEHQEAQSTYGTQEKSNCCNGEESVWYISMRFCCDGDCSKRVGYQCHWFIFMHVTCPSFWSSSSSPAATRAPAFHQCCLRSFTHPEPRRCRPHWSVFALCPSEPCLPSPRLGQDDTHRVHSAQVVLSLRRRLS